MSAPIRVFSYRGRWYWRCHAISFHGGVLFSYAPVNGYPTAEHAAEIGRLHLRKHAERCEA